MVKADEDYKVMIRNLLILYFQTQDQLELKREFKRWPIMGAVISAISRKPIKGIRGRRWNMSWVTEKTLGCSKLSKIRADKIFDHWKVSESH